jgi:hypothetical protein
MTKTNYFINNAQFFKLNVHLRQSISFILDISRVNRFLSFSIYLVWIDFFRSPYISYQSISFVLYIFYSWTDKILLSAVKCQQFCSKRTFSLCPAFTFVIRYSNIYTLTLSTATSLIYFIIKLFVIIELSCVNKRNYGSNEIVFTAAFKLI